MTEFSRPQAAIAAPTRTDAAGVRHSYVRFAALGDSVTQASAIDGVSGRPLRAPWRV